MASETLSELLKRIASQAFANGEIEMDQRDALVAAYVDLLAASQTVVEECNPLPLNSAQHIAFAHLTNAIHRAKAEWVQS